MHDRSGQMRRFLTAAAIVGALAATGAAPASDKPSISVKANPAVGFSPARVVLTVEVKGGPNDYQDFYCATVEWDIDTLGGEPSGSDFGRAEAQSDCDPYEPGKSEIKRRYVREQIFKSSGEYRIQFRLKQKDRIVGSARTTVRIRPGLGDPGGDR
jgi:hypothetical protein